MKKFREPWDKSDLIALISLVVALFSAGLAWYSISTANRANELATQANFISQDGNRLAAEANTKADQANSIAREANSPSVSIDISPPGAGWEIVGIGCKSSDTAGSAFVFHKSISTYATLTNNGGRAVSLVGIALTVDSHGYRYYRAYIEAERTKLPITIQAGETIILRFEGATNESAKDELALKQLGDNLEHELHEATWVFVLGNGAQQSFSVQAGSLYPPKLYTDCEDTSRDWDFNRTDLHR